MKKLIFIFLTMFVLIIITGCNLRKNTIHFDIDSQGIIEDLNEETINKKEESDLGPDLTIISPEEKTLETNVGYHVVKGITPSKTHSIKINKYELARYQPGGNEWSYIASTGLGTLEEGENIYTVYALDKEGNEIDKKKFTIKYEEPEIPELPSTGSNEWIALMISIMISGGYFTVKHLRKIYT